MNSVVPLDPYGEGASLSKPAEADPEVALERITQIAATCCTAERAVIVVYDKTRFLVVGKRGDWTDRELAIVARQFPGPEPRVVPSLSADYFHEELGCRIDSLAVVPIPTGPGRIARLIIIDGDTLRENRVDLETLRGLASLAALHLQDRHRDGGRHQSLSLAHRYREVFQNHTDLAFTSDIHGNLIAVNRTVETFTGLTREELRNTNLADLAVPEQRELVRHLLLVQYGAGSSQDYALRFRNARGAVRDIELSVHLLFENGLPAGLMGFGRDVTASNHSERAKEETERRLGDTTSRLRAIEKRWRQLYRLSTSPHASFQDLATDCLQTGCRMLDASTAFVGKPAGDAIEIRAWHSEAGGPSPARISMTDHPALARLLAGRRGVEAPSRTYAPGICPGDDRRPRYLTVAPMVTGEKVAGVLCFTSETPPPLSSDCATTFVEYLAGLLAREYEASQFGGSGIHPVTGLPNSVALQQLLNRAVKRADRDHGRLGIVVMDVDALGSFNQRFGFEAGNEALRVLASRFRECLGPDNELALQEADRFVALASGVAGADAVRELARRFLKASRQPQQVFGREVTLTVSAGTSIYPDDARTGYGALRKAETAMVMVKRRGKNDLEHCRPGVFVPRRGRVAMAPALERALENDELMLTFQPEVSIDGQLDNFEVLVAWDHPVKGRLSASKFVPAAEECGLIVPVGSWVLQQACKQCAAWRQEGKGLICLAVNVSALQFDRTDLAADVAESLRRYDLPPEILELEVTESAIMRDAAHSIRSMERLRETGVRLAIDDFGTGYSSLSYLSRFPVQTLKLDRSFLRQHNRLENAFPTIKAIASLAHTMDMTAVGEGVETVSDLRLLERAGYDRLQGRLFGWPQTADIAGNLLTSRLQFSTLATPRGTE